MTDAELERINAERRRRGLAPLTRSQATDAVIASPQRHDDGFNSTDFLIGYMTGIPMPSAGGIIGAMLHPSPSAPDPSPSYNAPEPSGPASHDYSPSYDSGSASGGSDGGGGGGGGGGE